MDKMTLAAVAVLVFMTGTAFAQPVLPTELNLNLLNADGSNIDVNLLIKIDYTDGGGTSQSMNSVDNAGDGIGDTIDWGIFDGTSNVYSEVSAKGGTDITVTVDGYEPIAITAAEAILVSGNYILNNVTPISPTTTTTTISTTTTIPSLTNVAEGGAPAVATTVSVEDEGVVMTAPSISSGSSATFIVPPSEETPVRQLVVKVAKDVKDLEVTVNILAAKPADVETEVGGVLYMYIDISHTVSDAEINSATINFDVEKSWVSDNNIDPDSVTLNRYSGGKWTALATTRLSDGLDHHVYEAVSPGLSVFGISASIATDAPTTTIATITGGIRPPVTTVPPEGGKPIGKVLFAVLALAIVMFAAYHYRKK
ncbi:MAG: PGF-pre-PGF domain-containing protein [Candidatus Hydrothermarchaeaceae archaeon]